MNHAQMIGPYQLKWHWATGTRSAQAEDKELIAHNICNKKNIKNITFNNPFKV